MEIECNHSSSRANFRMHALAQSITFGAPVASTKVLQDCHWFSIEPRDQELKRVPLFRKQMRAGVDELRTLIQRKRSQSIFVHSYCRQAQRRAKHRINVHTTLARFTVLNRYISYSIYHTIHFNLSSPVRRTAAKRPA